MEEMKTSDTDARAAIQAVIDHLEREWIVEACATEGPPVEGCWSCRAVSLRSELREFDAQVAALSEPQP